MGLCNVLQRIIVRAPNALALGGGRQKTLPHLLQLSQLDLSSAVTWKVLALDAVHSLLCYMPERDHRVHPPYRPC